MENSEIMCCIAGCDRVGTRDLNSKLFCYPHWVEEMNEVPKEGRCCSSSCDRASSSAFEGKLYCYQHWLEKHRGKLPERNIETSCEKECTGCDDVPFKCCIKNCGKEGVITEIGTLDHYCIDHAWKVDRPDENGLVHPLQARWNAEDTLRAHGAGLVVNENTLPPVCESVAEECRRELEEGKKRGWRSR